jgi:hypothetical protein
MPLSRGRGTNRRTEAVSRDLDVSRKYARKFVEKSQFILDT